MSQSHIGNLLQGVHLDWSVQSEEQFQKTKNFLVHLHHMAVMKWLDFRNASKTTRVITESGVLSMLDDIERALGTEVPSVQKGILGMRSRPFLLMNGWEVYFILPDGRIQPVFITTCLSDHLFTMQTQYKLQSGYTKPLTPQEVSELGFKLSLIVAEFSFKNRQLL